RQQDRSCMDRRRSHRGIRLPCRARLRLDLSRAGGAQHRQQSMGHFDIPGYRARRLRHVRRARPRLRHSGAARRRQRLSRGSCRRGLGLRTGAAKPRPDPDRACDLSCRCAFDLRRSLRLSAEGGVRCLAARRSRDQAEESSDHARRLVAGAAKAGRSRNPRHRDRGAEKGRELRHAQLRAETIGARHVRGRVRRDAGTPAPSAPAGGSLIVPRRTMIEAIREAMDVMMARDEDVVVFGEDVGYFGGVFRASQGLQAKYGTNRCFDTPISELGIVGAAIGMAAYGLKPCVEIQFADYMYPAYDQIVSEAARLRYRSNGQFTCPLVVRMPTGGGIFGGQTHSQSPEALFTHVCGLKTVVPSNPSDAKGLLIAAIEDPDPVIFLEPKRLYNGPFDG